MRANSTSTPTQQAGFAPTAALVGAPLFQAVGWRLGAGVLLLASCPLATAGGGLLSFVDRCVDVVRSGGSYPLCGDYSAERWIGVAVLALAVLFLLGAVGLWKRGGAVRDIEILAERVEGAD